MSIEFVAWPKTPRLFRDCVITEKIDGTNAAVGVTDDLTVYAQSRSRIITPAADNHGFAAWVEANAEALASLLGPGLHFGEWWGSGIQRRYGLTGDDKRFSMFNVARWRDADLSDVRGLGVVPVLWAGQFQTGFVDAALYHLRVQGSTAAPGFMRPEGVCVFHSQSRQVYKATLENDDEYKSRVAA